MQQPLKELSIAAPVRAPRTAEEQRQLLARQPPAWEYLLFAGVLAQGKESLESKWRDHQLRYVRRAGPALSDAEVPSFIQGALRELAGLTRNIERIFDNDAKERAFGPPGVPGDPAQIEHIAERALELYGSLLEWSAHVRGTPISDQFTRAFELLALFADGPIREMRAFIDQCVEEVDKIPERVKDESDEPIGIILSITFDIDKRVSSEFDREMKRLRRRGLLV